MTTCEQITQYLVRRTSWLSTILAFGAVVAVTGCDQAPSPIPPAKSVYVGVWEQGTYPVHSLAEFRGRYVFLQITQDGYLAYARFQKTENTSTCTVIGRSPLKTLTDNQIDVSFLWFFTTSFEVNEPPHQVAGEWKMTVDGNELTKSARSADQLPFTCYEG